MQGFIPVFIPIIHDRIKNISYCVVEPIVIMDIYFGLRDNRY